MRFLRDNIDIWKWKTSSWVRAIGLYESQSVTSQFASYPRSTFHGVQCLINNISYRMESMCRKMNVNLIRIIVHNCCPVIPAAGPLRRRGNWQIQIEDGDVHKTLKCPYPWHVCLWRPRRPHPESKSAKKYRIVTVNSAGYFAELCYRGVHEGNWQLVLCNK